MTIHSKKETHMTTHQMAVSHDNVANDHRPLASTRAGCRRLAAVGLLMAVAAVPALAQDTREIGGIGGARFSRLCPTDHFLVGMTGRAGNLMDQVAPVCAPADLSGRWTGPPSTGQAAGGSGGGPFTTMCPQDSFVVGFSGYADKFVFNIALWCRHKGPNSVDFRRASPRVVGGALSTGSTSVFSCPAESTAHGIVGRSGVFVDRIGLACVASGIGLGSTRWSSRTFPPPNGGLLVITIMADGNPACASYNGASCLWGVTLAEIDQARLKPLVCGEAHRARWGATGFEDATHWCSLARRNP
jgi:hypothetical protein